MEHYLEVRSVSEPKSIEGSDRQYRQLVLAPTWTTDTHGRRIRMPGKIRTKNVWNDDVLFDSAEVGDLLPGKAVTVKTTPHTVQDRVVTTHTFVLLEGETIEQLAKGQKFSLVKIGPSELETPVSEAGNSAMAPPFTED